MAIDRDLGRRIATAARKSREWLSRRDRMILQALDEGATQAEVAKWSGLTQPGVHHIAHRDDESSTKGR